MEGSVRNPDLTPSSRQAARRARFSGARRSVAVVALGSLVAAAAGIVFVGRSHVPPTATVVPSTTAIAAPFQAGYRRFTAPGISFLYPESWTTQPIPSELQDSWSHRYLGFLSDGPPECWLLPTSPATGGGPTPCTEDGQAPGSLELDVSEYTDPVPGESNYGRPLSFAPSPTYEMAAGNWYVTDPGGGIYELAFSTPYGEAEGRRDEMVAIIRSITLTDWRRQPPPAVDGKTVITMGPATFSYPSTWTTYKFMPWYRNMVGSGPILLFASKPLEPCIPVDGCHLGEPPDGAVVIQIAWVSPAFRPNWSDADTTIGGRPAMSDTPSVFKGVEHLGWSVQVDDSGNTALEIDAAMRPDANAGLRQQLDAFLTGMKLAATPPTEAP